MEWILKDPRWKVSTTVIDGTHAINGHGSWSMVDGLNSMVKFFSGENHAKGRYENVLERRH
jgi:hypothetical protein